MMLTLHDPQKTRENYASGAWQAETMFGLLQRHTLERPEDVALRDLFTSMTWAEVMRAVEQLALDLAQVHADDRRRITVNAHFQTNVEHIYAVGDVIGFPSLASTSYEQGRAAARHAFGVQEDHAIGIGVFPYGIYTVPEISTIGKNEDELTAAGIPYEIGKANYREIARGQIIGDRTGVLKLIFSPVDKRLLAVHILGEGASELIHIGQAVMAHNGTIDYFADAVFNYPTLAECYKSAALDGLNRLQY